MISAHVAALGFIDPFASLRWGLSVPSPLDVLITKVTELVFLLELQPNSRQLSTDVAIVLEFTIEPPAMIVLPAPLPRPSLHSF